MTNTSQKIVRCYCNVKAICPKTDYCDTNSVCLAKHVKRKNEKSEEEQHYYNYYCAEYSQNSFRNDIIQFRDCYLKTSNQNDRKYVIENSAEYCCDDADMCNRDLEPIQSVYDFTPDPSAHNNRHSSNLVYVVSTSQLILIVAAVFALMIFAAVVVAVIYVSRKTRKNNEKLKLASMDVSSKSSENSPFIIDSLKETKTKKKSRGCVYIPKKIKNIYKKGKQQQPIYKLEPATPEAEEKPYIIGEGLLKSNIFAAPSSAVTSDHTSITIHTHTPQPTIITSISSANSSSQCISPSTSEGDTNSGSHQDYGSSFLDSGSGSGNPVVINRTIARDIRLIDRIGKGRYGEVWKAKWCDEPVAVKTFTSAETKSWENEINIYLTQCLRDENILGFIAADNVDRGMFTELWIITDYHENGALYDYLNVKTVTPKQMITMALSISKGLNHLHRQIIGLKGKLALAHCDLKTKNILVKSDLSCCIGDLGLAICADAENNVPAGIDIRTGTKRYMAPEILDRTINARSIGAYQKADMYSLSLVFWEMLRRCEYFEPTSSEHVCYNFQLPYYDKVDANPDENQMKDIICRQKLRPEMLDIWKFSKLECIKGFASLMQELWHENPDGRLTSMNVKKSLDKIKNSFNTIPEQV